MFSIKVFLFCAAIAPMVMSEDTDAMKQLEQLVCGKALTEQQCNDIITNCPCDKQPILDKALLICFKTDKLTQQQRVTGFCGPQKQCIMDEMSKNSDKDSQDAIQKKVLDKINCIKEKVNLN